MNPIDNTNESQKKSVMIQIDPHSAKPCMKKCTFAIVGSASILYRV